MNQERIDVFYYDETIASLKQDWMKDMAVVFREFDEDQDGKMEPNLAQHVLRLFRLDGKDSFKGMSTVKLAEFLDEAAVLRDGLVMNPAERYQYYFRMIAGPGKSEMSARDIQRFLKVFGDDVLLKFCDDFIDEFDPEHLSKDVITEEEFCAFCQERKIPI